MLEIKDLHVSVAGKKVLNGLTLSIPDGELHVIMGPNGAGKSTLGLVLAGHPKCIIESGTVMYNGKNVLSMSPEERSVLGMFLAFQYPFEIPGVTLSHFLYTTCRKKNPTLKASEFRTHLTSALALVGLPATFAERHLNVGLSGGEKKRCEIVQILMLSPSFVVLDEADSGLDIDSLKTVSSAINTLRKKASLPMKEEGVSNNPDFSCLLITHYSRILQYITPDKVHVLIEGKIAFSGDATLPSKLEKEGYAWLEVDETIEREKTQKDFIRTSTDSSQVEELQ